MAWISQAKWCPEPLRPGLGGTRVSHVLCPPPLPIRGGTKVDLEVAALAGSQQGGWGGTMVVVTESKFCKIKERRDHTAYLIGFFLRRAEKFRIRRFERCGKRKGLSEIPKMWWELPAENWWSVPALPQPFTWQTLPVTSIKSGFLPSTLFLDGERDQEAENTCYSTGQKRISFPLSPPSLAMTYSKIAQNSGQAGISRLARWGKMCSGVIFYSNTWPCWPSTKWTVGSSGEGYWGLLQFVPSAACELCISFFSTLLVNLKCRSSIFLSGPSSQ